VDANIYGRRDKDLHYITDIFLFSSTDHGWAKKNALPTSNLFPFVFLVAFLFFFIYEYYERCSCTRLSGGGIIA
jgi:ABC-type transport system involved in cytochrome c biogenesis permease subunit